MTRSNEICYQTEVKQSVFRDEVLSLGAYMDDLKRFEDAFGADHLLILLTDDLAQRPGSPKRRKRVFVIALLFLTAVVEVISFFATGFLVNRGVVYGPGPASDVDQYFKERHRLLGWPSASSDPEQLRDESGARLSPLFPDRIETPPAVSVYGDSFSWSEGVGDKDAWPEILSGLMSARVDNFGVGGYGSDQALLRYRDNCQREVETAPVVVLMHFTENILRNVNQYRDLLYRGKGFGLKPRFVINSNGELTLIPLPGIPPEQYKHFVTEPEAYLAHETFVCGGLSGPVRSQFPFTLTVIRSLTHSHVVANFRSEPWHMPFYDSNHHSQGLAVTLGIMNAFHDTAKERDQQPLVVILPTLRDFEYRERTGIWSYASLVQRLSEERIPTLDLGPRMRERMAGRSFSDLYGTIDPHHNERGYQMISEIVHEDLKHRALCP